MPLHTHTYTHTHSHTHTDAHTHTQYTLPRLTQEMRGGSVSTRNPPKQSDDKTTNYAHIRQPSNNTYLIPEYNGPCHLRRRVKSVEVLLGSDTDDGSQSPHSPAFRGYPFHKPTSSIKIPNGRIRIRSDYHSTDFDDKSTPKVISLGSGKFDDSLPPKRQGSMGSITSSSSIIQIVTGTCNKKKVDMSPSKLYRLSLAPNRLINRLITGR